MATQLALFLKRHHPHDIVMPVTDKAPMFPHKDGAWTWEALESYKRTSASKNQKDYGVLLHDLCVIDVDTEDAAKDLEYRFPLLSLVPCEKTSRGFHYWFIRPDNECMYFDGAAQVTPKIDFKSIHKNGTSGLVVTAPSKGKRWITELSTDRLVECPEEILEAVAKKVTANVTLTLIFLCGEKKTYKDNTWLGNMSYFDAATDIDGDFPVPCTRLSFDNVLYVLDHNELDIDEPSREALQEMIQVADMLGLTKGVKRLTNSLTTGVPRAQLDMYEANPLWWRATLAERQLDVTYMYDHHEPNVALPIDERFLFFDKNDDPKTTQLMYTSSNDIDKYIPLCVETILKKYPGKIVLAGGMAASIVCPMMPPGHDNDLFFIGCDELEANEMLRDIVGKSSFYMTRNAVTIERNGVILQIILRLCDDPMKLIVGFDIAACKVCIYFDGHKFVSVQAPTFVEAVRCGAFPIDFTKWSAAAPIRVMKYVLKGFDVFVPGMRRAAMTRSGGFQGLDALMDCEAYLGEKPQEWKELLYLKHICLKSSDYSDNARFVDSIRRLFKRMKEFFFGPNKLPVHVTMTRRGVMHAIGPMFSKCYDMEILKTMLST